MTSFFSEILASNPRSQDVLENTSRAPDLELSSLSSYEDPTPPSSISSARLSPPPAQITDFTLTEQHNVNPMQMSSVPTRAFGTQSSNNHQQNNTVTPIPYYQHDQPGTICQLQSS